MDKIIHAKRAVSKNKNVNNNDTQIYKNVIKQGTHFNPAKGRYGNRTDLIISCDRCDKDELDECVGFNSTDLCMKCAGEVSRSMRPHGRWAGIHI